MVRLQQKNGIFPPTRQPTQRSTTIVTAGFTLQIMRCMVTQLVLSDGIPCVRQGFRGRLSRVSPKHSPTAGRHARCNSERFFFEVTSACPSSQICSIILFELHVFPVRCAPAYPPPPPPPPPLLWRRHRAGPRRETALQARSQLSVPFPHLLACSTAFQTDFSFELCARL